MTSSMCFDCLQIMILSVRVYGLQASARKSPRLYVTLLANIKKSHTPLSLCPLLDTDLLYLYVDGDGNIEIAVGFSDRIVRTYRWYEHSDGRSGEIVALNKWALDAQVSNMRPEPQW